jgi:adenylate kinase
LYNQSLTDKKKKDKQKLDKPKLQDEVIILAYRWKLRQNACLNRGFILDNFPKSYEQCKELFMEKKKVESDDDDEKYIYDLNTVLMPNKLCILKGADQDLINRTKKLQSEKYLESVYVDRRLKLYKQRNEDDAGVSTPLF